MKKKKIVQCFTLDPDIAEHIAQFADANKISKSAAVNLICAVHAQKVGHYTRLFRRELEMTPDELDKIEEERMEERRLEDEMVKRQEEREALEESVKRRKYGQE